MMQEAFSNPPDYFFKNGRINEFKKALDATLTKFKSVPKVNQAAVANAKRGAKRKAGEMEHQDEFANTFNPKYLTSRELFSLEVRLPLQQQYFRLINAAERLGISKTHIGPSAHIIGLFAVTHG
jgi:hypothetical protein